jgi:enoyl-CoA hydratase/carnithine racemase
MDTDASLVEINPLILEGNGNIKALDAKFNFDANALAERLATMPTTALVATRALLQSASTRSLSAHLDVERDTQSAMGATHDYIEGVTAFLEKRGARFTGK